MKKHRPTQVERIIQYIKDYGSISTLEAFRDLGITKLTTRVSEMRSAGITIIGKPESAKNRYGEKCRTDICWLNIFVFPRAFVRLRAYLVGTIQICSAGFFWE